MFVAKQKINSAWLGGLFKNETFVPGAIGNGIKLQRKFHIPYREWRSLLDSAVLQDQNPYGVQYKNSK